MQINKSKKPSSRQSSSTMFDNDFASGFEDSKFEKFKPAIKALAVVILLVGVIWGAVAYFSGTDEQNDTNKNYVSGATQQDEDNKLAQCTVDMESKSPIPKSDDDSFYPKLIAYYDAQIDCYDQYPDAKSVISRSSLEYARDNALDSSGSYKDTYTSFSSGSSNSSTSSKSSVTGCDYSLSESEYLACSDRYYAAHSSPSSTPSSSVGTPSYTPPTSTPSTPPSTGGNPSGSSSGSSSSAADKAYWQGKCEQQVQQQAGGTSMNASQRTAMVAQCMSSHGY